MLPGTKACCYASLNRSARAREVEGQVSGKQLHSLHARREGEELGFCGSLRDWHARGDRVGCSICGPVVAVERTPSRQSQCHMCRLCSIRSRSCASVIEIPIDKSHGWSGLFNLIGTFCDASSLSARREVECTKDYRVGSSDSITALDTALLQNARRYTHSIQN